MARVDDGSRIPLRLLVRGADGVGKTTLVGRLLRDAADRHTVVADAPARDQSARGLTAPAESAELAVLVVDATAGIDDATRREAFLVSLLGVEKVVLAVNKMDLVEFSGQRFAALEAAFRVSTKEVALPDVAAVPISATRGDHVTDASPSMGWYRGPTLLELSRSVAVDRARFDRKPLRLRVQRLNAGDGTATGVVVSGRVRLGDEVRAQPSGRIGRVTRLEDDAGDVEEAGVGRSLTLTLEDSAALSGAELVVAADRPVELAAQFEATVAWTSEAPLFPGRSYVLDLEPGRVSATIVPLKYKLDPASLERAPATKLEQGEIGVCNLQLERQIPFEPYRENRSLGGFVLIDPVSGATVGAGMLHFALRRAQNVHWQAVDVNKAARAAQKGQKPCVLWFTGLSGAGKSAIANLVDRKLHAMNRHGYLLDGDNVRHGLNKDLGFTAADRVENIRRIAEVAKLMVDAGLIVSTAFISPFRAERRMARALLAPGEFIEVFVDTPLAVAEARDPKGLYKKARRGELKNFTGIDSPYEIPEHAELRVDTTHTSAEAAADTVLAYLTERGFLDPARNPTT